MTLLLTRLANEETDIVAEDRCVSIKEITRQIHHHRQLCQLFKQLPCLTVATHKPSISQLLTITSIHFIIFIP